MSDLPEEEPAPPVIVASTSKVKKVSALTVGDFHQAHAHALKLEQVCGGQTGLTRQISEPTVNRPGLAMTGFYTYFAYRRIQVLGHAEYAYLKTLPQEEQIKCMQVLCSTDLPCLVLCRAGSLPDHLMEVIAKHGICVFRSTMDTMKFINTATLRLEYDFAPTTSEHGCMVDVRGIGVLIKGASGLGKSEAVLGLLERGAALVADDKVVLRSPDGGELTGTADERGRFHMEVRGIGIVNVPLLFGIGSMRIEKRLDLVVQLLPLEDLDDIDRVGMNQKFYRVLEHDVPYRELPVAAGRDLARLVEVAALEQKLRSFGHNTAEEFDKRLLQLMEAKRMAHSAIS